MQATWLSAGSVIVPALVLGDLVLIEAISRVHPINAELVRKISHVSAGIIVIMASYVLPLHLIAVESLGFIPLLLLSRKKDWLHSIHAAERSSWGEVWFPLGIAIAGFFLTYLPAFILGVGILAMADGAAGLIGSRYGRYFYSIWGRKSLEGSAVFFMITWGLAAIILGITTSGLPVLLLALGLAAALTLMEGSLSWGLDNLCLPVFAGLLFEAVAH